MDRTKGIGGSDLAALFGISPWKSKVELYLEKTGERVNNLDNEYIHYGNEMEYIIIKDYIRKHYSKFQAIKYAVLTGGGVRKNYNSKNIKISDVPIIHKDYPFLIGNPDAIDVPNNRIVEAKNTSKPDQWGQDGTDQVPLAYMLQVQHYMLCTGLKGATIAVLFFGNTYKEYYIKYDEQVGKAIIRQSKDFWYNNVLKKQPPETSGRADVNLIYKPKDYKKITADTAIVEIRDQLVILQRELKITKEKIEENKDIIAVAMKDATEMVDDQDQIIFSYKANKRGVRTLLTK